MNRTLFWTYLALGCMSFGWLGSVRADQLTLADTVRYALEHSPRFDTAQRQMALGQLEVKTAMSGFLPSLDLAATHGLRDQTPRPYEVDPTGRPWASELNLSLTENLYDNGVSLTKYKVARLQKQMSDVQLLQSRDQLILDVAQLFLQLSQAQKVLEVQRSQFDLIQKQYRQMETAFQQGLKTRKDYLRFKTQVQRAELDLTDAERSIEKLVSQLHQLMGTPAGAHFDFKPDEAEGPHSIPVQPPPLDQVFEVRIQQIQKDVYDLNRTLVTRLTGPEINFETSLKHGYQNYLGSGASFDQSRLTSWDALLKLKYNLWDWGQRRNNAAIATQKQQIANNDLTTRELAIRSDIEQLMTELARLKDNLSLSRELLGLETGSFQTMQIEYRNGKVTYLDLVTALRDFSDARLRFLNSTYEVKRALLRYRFYEGRLYDVVLAQ